MKIILINGQGGTGKTLVANALKNKITNSALIDADALIGVNPFEFDKLAPLMFRNAVTLISNFSNAGYQTIITSGLTRNQEQLDSFLALVPDTEVVLVWLHADRETRIARKLGRARDGADNLEWFEFGEKIYPDVKDFVMRRGKYFKIDTSAKTIDEVVSEIEKMIS